MKLSLLEFLNEDHGNNLEQKATMAAQYVCTQGQKIQQLIQAGQYVEAFKLADELDRAKAVIQNSLKQHIAQIKNRPQVGGNAMIRPGQ